MALSTEQLTLLKHDIEADPILGALAHTGDNAYTIAAAYNQRAEPEYWVWRTSLAEKDIYEDTAPDLTVWNWGTYKAQSVQDRDSWARMFNPGSVNPSLKQTRDGWAAIFGGQGASLAQVNFLLALARRLATRAEDLFAESGSGTTAAPGVMGFEGQLMPSDVENAWAIQ